MTTERKQRTKAEPIALLSWRAKRAGAAITIEGVDAAGRKHKVVGVAEMVRSATAGVGVVGRDGQRFELI